MGEYYKNHKEHWRKNGKYYYYKPKVNTYQVTIKRGLFLVNFD